MNWSKDHRRGRKGYHHGNLREALIEAARALIAEKGASGLTFAEAARRAGVSAAAPYRHYRDRDQLLSDVALRGFELFENALTEAWRAGQPETMTAFERVGRAYLQFAREEPAYFAAMFESGIAIEPGTELSLASERAFAVLRTVAEAICERIPEDTRPPVMMTSLHIWSIAHGIAALFSRGDGARRKTPISPQDLLESAMLVYLQGLGLPGGRKE